MKKTILLALGLMLFVTACGDDDEENHVDDTPVVEHEEEDKSAALNEAFEAIDVYLAELDYDTSADDRRDILEDISTVILSVDNVKVQNVLQIEIQTALYKIDQENAELPFSLVEDNKNTTFFVEEDDEDEDLEDYYAELDKLAQNLPQDEYVNAEGEGTCIIPVATLEKACDLDGAEIQTNSRYGCYYHHKLDEDGIGWPALVHTTVYWDQVNWTHLEDSDKTIVARGELDIGSGSRWYQVDPFSVYEDPYPVDSPYNTRTLFVREGQKVLHVFENINGKIWGGCSFDEMVDVVQATF